MRGRQDRNRSGKSGGPIVGLTAHRIIGLAFTFTKKQADTFTQMKAPMKATT
jgi:hypothetical protein